MLSVHSCLLISLLLLFVILISQFTKAIFYCFYSIFKNLYCLQPKRNDLGNDVQQKYTKIAIRSVDALLVTVQLQECLLEIQKEAAWLCLLAVFPLQSLILTDQSEKNDANDSY
ncbi:hypothetical protein EB796_002995 [Bugula neritina]|uniref:Uncharacterized protein n=1 Tax=Bugula neritina TaxID=10212 RepID=A0A7J7K0Y7_BUGNE|nr:hypothetical protein EB796_009400 [Bugula neritina]KAF6038694.1 hypothetical protein EB796_002995 [Bugula neritina]